VRYFDESDIPEARIELTPLIDVVFLLLTFFVFALVVSARLEVTEIELPPIRAGEGQGPAPAVVMVELTPDGAVRVEGEAIDLAQVGPRLTTAFQADPDAALVLAADRTAPVGQLLAVIDALGEAGYSDFRILREPDDQPPPTSQP
jgi:biopolymer transport protein ExbD